MTLIPDWPELREEWSESEWSVQSESESGKSIFPAGADFAPTEHKE